MVINTNMEALQTANNLNVSQTELSKSLSRLSSGSRIIKPSDDAAGLAVTSRLRAQIKRLDSAMSNVVNAVSFTQTQDGFMKTMDKALRRMGELAMLAKDGTKSSGDLQLYQKEFKRWFTLVAEINPLLALFRIKDSGIPTLYIMGEEDHMFLPSISKLVKDHVSSKLFVIANCGHVVNVEQPDIFNLQVLKFIEKRK